MRTFGVVVDAPHLDDCWRFLETVEDLTIEAFVPELCSVVPASLQATAIVLPCACKTSIWRSFVTICSAANLFLAIFFLFSSSTLSHRLVQKKPVRSRSGIWFNSGLWLVFPAWFAFWGITEAR